MKTNVFVRDSRHVKYWWVSLIAGLLSILVGVLCLVTPDATLVALSMLFIAVLLVDGIMDIVLAASNSDMLRGWGWMLVTGIMELLLAIMLMVMPIGSVVGTLIYVVGFWILFRAFWALGEAYEFRRYTDGSWLIILAVLAIIFSFFFLVSPAWNGLFIVSMISLAFFAYGIYVLRMRLPFALWKKSRRSRRPDIKPKSVAACLYAATVLFRNRPINSHLIIYEYFRRKWKIVTACRIAM